MALQLKQSLNLAQQLIMTPQLQQAIKLLQLSRLELLETVSQEMETNPILEELPPEETDYERGNEEPTVSQETGSPDESGDRTGDDQDWESYVAEYNSSWRESGHVPREAPPFESMTSSKPNLYSHLMFQLNMSRLSQIQKEIGLHIIGNLDEDGYLKASLEEIAQATGRSEEEVIETLYLIQNFDPVGVAARDTRECLLIQVRFQNLDGTIVEKIIQDHMDKLENKRYDLIARSLSVPLDEVLAAISVITRLEPKPGRPYSGDEPIYINPDIHVFKVG
ncbi:MAG: RNA polymerase sigma-54 factor, partial [Deltaproteobacteria bacterium]|nr:RNA polymerase sigma-54 factor [Deltaproteobacteria bacterium]